VATRTGATSARSTVCEPEADFDRWMISRLTGTTGGARDQQQGATAEHRNGHRRTRRRYQRLPFPNLKNVRGHPRRYPVQLLVHLVKLFGPRRLTGPSPGSPSTPGMLGDCGVRWPMSDEPLSRHFVKAGIGAAHLLPEIKRQLDAAFTPLPSPLPPHLYHYTTLQGLEGIVLNNNMWATNAAYLNDHSELRYGHQLLVEAINRLGVETGGGLSEQATRLLDRCRLADPTADERLHVYLTCFCKEPDLLSQWRAYSTSGGGYALEVEPSSFLSLPGLRMIEVIYDRRQQESHVHRLLRTALETMEANAKALEPKDADTLAFAFVQMIIVHLWEFFISVKDPAFREEQEWRLVWTSSERFDDALRFRRSGGLLVPFVELDVCAPDGDMAGRLPVTNVVMGPTVSNDLAETSLRMFLTCRGYASTGIRRSVVPLRGL
jgi:hypothetical protein